MYALPRILTYGVCIVFVYIYIYRYTLIILSVIRRLHECMSLLCMIHPFPHWTLFISFRLSALLWKLHVHYYSFTKGCHIHMSDMPVTAFYAVKSVQWFVCTVKLTCTLVSIYFLFYFYPRVTIYLLSILSICLFSFCCCCLNVFGISFFFSLVVVANCLFYIVVL